MSDWHQQLFDRTVYELLIRRSPEKLAQESQQWVDLLGLRSGHRVLEQCAGTGEMLHQLQLRSITVAGFDSSKVYVKMFQYPFMQIGDVRLPQMAPASFDFVVNWYSSFGYFSDAENLQVLHQAYRNLVTGGTYLIETLNPVFIKNHFRPEMTHQQGSLSIVRHTRLEEHHSIQHWIICNGTQKHTLESRVRLYTVEELCGLLKSVGFIDLRVFDEHNQPFVADVSERMRVLGTKT